VRLVEERRLDPQVSVVTGWEQAEPALRQLQGRQLNGKVILRIG
jgi:hypothetical protein